MTLSEHFSLEEMTFSETAARQHIDNTPNAEEIEKLRWLAGRLEEVRDLLGPMHINSGYRCLALNRALGSQDTSQHLKCEAADCTSIAGLSPLGMCTKVQQSDIAFDQCILEYGSWMHVSFTQGVPRGQMLTIDHNGTRLGIPTA
jgi:zinc D-Ala-D-Ala carboxypeptidase